MKKLLILLLFVLSYLSRSAGIEQTDYPKFHQFAQLPQEVQNLIMKFIIPSNDPSEIFNNIQSLKQVNKAFNNALKNDFVVNQLIELITSKLITFKINVGTLKTTFEGKPQAFIARSLIGDDKGYNDLAQEFATLTQNFLNMAKNKEIERDSYLLQMFANTFIDFEKSWQASFFTNLHLINNDISNTLPEQVITELKKYKNILVFLYLMQNNKTWFNKAKKAIQKELIKKNIIK